MGYKLAGCDVIGCCEIDKKMNDVYVKNHNPKYNFNMDIRDFNAISNNELPDELFNLDILDGSPPCTTFSMAGQREKNWGKKKKFREGQSEQTLDDLSFIFIKTVAKLKPKCVIIENVEGLIKGAAWGYVQEIYRQFNNIEYRVAHYLLKGEEMGVPQKRHRVFFIALRKDVDFDLSKLNMYFNYKSIPYKTIKTGVGRKPNINSKTYKLLCNAQYGDKSLSEAYKRLYKKEALFNRKLLYDDIVVNTITPNCLNFIHYKTKRGMSVEDIIFAQTFPFDYNFINRSLNNVAYICGMSVPPIMIKRIVNRLIECGVI